MGCLSPWNRQIVALVVVFDFGCKTRIRESLELGVQDCLLVRRLFVEAGLLNHTGFIAQIELLRGLIFGFFARFDSLPGARLLNGCLCLVILYVHTASESADGLLPALVEPVGLIS